MNVDDVMKYGKGGEVERSRSATSEATALYQACNQVSSEIRRGFGSKCHIWISLLNLVFACPDNELVLAVSGC